MNNKEFIDKLSKYTIWHKDANVSGPVVDIIKRANPDCEHCEQERANCLVEYKWNTRPMQVPHWRAKCVRRQTWLDPYTDTFIDNHQEIQYNCAKFFKVPLKNKQGKKYKDK